MKFKQLLTFSLFLIIHFISFGQEVEEIEYQGRTWLNRNYYDNTQSNPEGDFSYEESEKICQSIGKGWRIPTEGEWDRMLNLTDPYYNLKSGKMGFSNTKAASIAYDIEFYITGTFWASSDQGPLSYSINSRQVEKAIEKDNLSWMELNCMCIKESK